MSFNFFINNTIMFLSTVTMIIIITVVHMVSCCKLSKLAHLLSPGASTYIPVVLFRKSYLLFISFVGSDRNFSAQCFGGHADDFES